MQPKSLKHWLIIIALLYLVFPRDLIPDFIGGGIGFVDDLLLMAGLAYFYRTRLQNEAAHTTGESARSSDEHDRAETRHSEATFDPYQVLGIPSSSSSESIRSAYRLRMTEYHPDKVAHLGDELQELAHKKVLEIQKAYRQLVE
jgi:DnaJ-domain-containing protein 1